MKLERFSIGSALLLATTLAAAPARAQRSADTTAAAEALFEDGKRLAAAGNYAEACPKFLSSQTMDPGVGTLLNLADCYEKNGQTASAWARFLEAASLARTAGDSRREKIARDRAAAVERQLVRLTILFPAGADKLDVQRDGIAVDRPTSGTPVPIDPGSHTIEARAPGKKTWTTTVKIASSTGDLKVDILVLQDDRPAAPVVAPTPPPQPSPVAPPPASPAAAPHGEAPPAATGSSQRTMALVAGGIGVVGVAVGTVFGLKAKSKWSDATALCAGTAHCDPQALPIGDEAKSAADLATVGFAVGGVGLAAATVLWLTAPVDGGSTQAAGLSIVPSAGPGTAGGLLRGTF